MSAGAVRIIALSGCWPSEAGALGGVV